MTFDKLTGTAAGAVRRSLAAAVFRAAFFIVALSPAVLPQRALAASQCAPHAALARHLAERFGETPRAVGLISDTRIVQLYSAPGGSWTIVVATADGRACILAAGRSWHDIALPDQADEPGDPA